MLLSVTLTQTQQFIKPGSIEYQQQQKTFLLTHLQLIQFYSVQSFIFSFLNTMTLNTKGTYKKILNYRHSYLNINLLIKK